MFKNLVLMPAAAELNICYWGCWIFLCGRKSLPGCTVGWQLILQQRSLGLIFNLIIFYIFKRDIIYLNITSLFDLFFFFVLFKVPVAERDERQNYFCVFCSKYALCSDRMLSRLAQAPPHSHPANIFRFERKIQVDLPRQVITLNKKNSRV